MSEDILRADKRLRTLTLIVLGHRRGPGPARHGLVPALAAGIGNLPGTDLLIVRLRRMIALALTGSGVCLALLAWYSAHVGSRAITLAAMAAAWCTGDPRYALSGAAPPRHASGASCRPWSIVLLCWPWPQA